MSAYKNKKITDILYWKLHFPKNSFFLRKYILDAKLSEHWVLNCPKSLQVSDTVITN